MKLRSKNTLLIIIILVFTGLLLSCTGQRRSEQEGKPRGVTIDTTFTEFFARDCCGLTGTDGFYSLLLPDGRTVWIFGDTFLGTVNPDNSRVLRDPVFVRNSIAVQDGDSLRTLYNLYEGKDASYFIPEQAYKPDRLAEDSIWFWPGDAFMENGKIIFFLSRFYQAEEDMWGIRWDGTYIARVSFPELEVEEIVPLSYPSEIEIHWGHSVCDDADDLQVPNHTYTFGVVKAAQARGDFAVLAERDRRALRVHLGEDTEAGLKQLESIVASVLG